MTDSTRGAVVARVERLLPALPEAVFRALTEPATMARWMSPFGRAEVEAAFTWRSPYTGPEPSVVTVELAARGSGTWLVLIHERLPGGVVESHEGGWRTMVERLVGLLADQIKQEVELR